MFDIGLMIQETTTNCSVCGIDTECNDMLCDDCDLYAQGDAEMEEAAEKADHEEAQREAYYDRPDVIAGEQFQDKLDMYRREH